MNAIAKNDSPLFDPARMPYRDAFGFVTHPDLDLFSTDAELYDEDALARSGFALAAVSAEDDAPELLTAYESHDEYALARWEPTLPEGDGWRLVGIFDTEAGPLAHFVRPLG